MAFYPSGVHMVKYVHFNAPQKFITLDKTRADEYAVHHRGICTELYEWVVEEISPSPVAEISPLDPQKDL